MLEAERQFRRIIGHGDLAKLAIAVERDIERVRVDANAHTPPIPTEETATLANV
jgi:hypothetical protein